MASPREILKRALPGFAREAVVRARAWAAPPPMEDIGLHDYVAEPDPDPGRRLTLVIPSVAAATAFGGVTTALEIFCEIGKRTGASLRILLDEFGRADDRSVVDKIARRAGVDPASVDIVPRVAWTPRVTMRAADVLVSYHSWITLNIQALLREQVRLFGGAPRPFLYAIQEYEPLFYEMSSTHMMARAAFDTAWPCWGIFNSGELHEFFAAQGHRTARAFVFEPVLSASLRPFLGGDAPEKTRRILVYGRPSIPRNCFPAIEKGLRQWAVRYPEHAMWEVVSAGLAHPPVRFAPNRAARSLGKLSLDDYAALLRGSAVGLSLMASPHPSYPPLEMAHFGLRTVTNSYANKDLSRSHPNILSVNDIAPATIADALAAACRGFEAEPHAGWTAPTARPSFLAAGPLPCLDAIAEALTHEVWAAA